VVVVGTTTEVGKTWVAARLIEQLRRDGRVVAARKPVQSFVEGDQTDAEVLARASSEHPEEVCPPHRWYPLAMAPPMAVQALGREPFRISDLLVELTWPDAVDVGIIEGAGGVRSPIAADGDCVALTDAVEPDAVVLVADASLGVVNLVRLCADALDRERLIVHLNRFDPGIELHQRNRQWLDRDGLFLSTSVEALASRLEGPPVSTGV
jgi:dethiobiotin synthetase